MVRPKFLAALPHTPYFQVQFFKMCMLPDVTACHCQKTSNLPRPLSPLLSSPQPLFSPPLLLLLSLSLSSLSLFFILYIIYLLYIYYILYIDIAKAENRTWIDKVGGDKVGGDKV